MRSFELIEEVYRRKREERERLRQSVLKKVFEALDRLRREVPFREAYIFGSLSRPYAFYESSDIDIAFCGLPEEKFLFAMAFLSDLLERDVDVVMLEKSKFKEKILREGIRWTPDLG